MDHIPNEVLRIILREATTVPNAAFYPVDANAEQDQKLFEKIADTMQTKCSISLVSKRFHDVGSEFFYETILLRDPEKIRPLVHLLRQTSEDRVGPGWWCRQLILDLERLRIDWKHGSITLWGLLPSCPRLQYLRCYLNETYRPPLLHYPKVDPSFRVPAVLLQTLATVHAPSLRSLHFGPYVIITKDLALSLLPHLKALEVCRFENLRAPDPYPPAGRAWPVSGAGGFDLFRGRYTHTEILDPTEAEEYEDAQKTATWPSSTNQITLPRFRTLQCHTLFPEIGQWQLPALNEVVVGVSHIFRTPSRLRVLQEALQPHSDHITHISYVGSAEFDPWHILPLVPHAKHARFILSHSSVSWEGLLDAPHTSISTLVVKDNHSEAGVISDALEGVENNILQGKLPLLSTIMLEAHDIDQDKLDNQEVTNARLALETLHVETEVTFVPENHRP